MGIEEYRREFLKQKQREEWSYHRILGRVIYAKEAQEGLIRARKAGPKRKALQIRVEDADNVVGFE